MCCHTIVLDLECISRMNLIQLKELQDSFERHKSVCPPRLSMRLSQAFFSGWRRFACMLLLRTEWLNFYRAGASGRADNHQEDVSFWGLHFSRLFISKGSSGRGLKGTQIPCLRALRAVWSLVLKFWERGAHSNNGFICIIDTDTHNTSH